MASRYFIYSTLTADQLYTAWTTPPKGGMAAIKHQVRVKGGANVANNHKVTPRGVRTEVTREDMEILKDLHVFQQHMKNGFITIREEKIDPEVAVAAEMEQKDKSAPFTPESREFVEHGGAPPMKESEKDAQAEPA